MLTANERVCRLWRFIEDMDFNIKHGLNIPIAGAPSQIIGNGPEISSVAVLCEDFHGVRPELLVGEGDRIGIGQPLYRDRNRPEIVFVAPSAGVVSEINFSHRRSLKSVVISCEGKESVSFDVDANTNEALLKSGLWTAFKTRPYGRIPDPNAHAEAVLVTAMDSNPLAADPAVIIQDARASFDRGLEILTSLEQGPVLVCQASGPLLSEHQNENLRYVKFSGKHPAGLPGIHLDRLGLSGKSVWQIGYQDVISIGHLFLTGRRSGERVVSVAGPMARNPRLLRTRQGTNLDDLLGGELREGAFKAISGSILSGRVSSFLGNYDTQVSVLPEPPRKRHLPFFRAADTDVPAAIIPNETLEGILPQKILAVPLMRALSVGDWETARKLGCLNLLEEDIAPLSYLCTSGADYSALLRLALDDLAEGV